MTAITELGYVRFGVSNLEAWRAFASDLLGLEVCDDPNGGRLFMRLDNWHHRIVLEEDGSDDILAAGLRVAGPEEFRAMQTVLSEAGVDFHICGPEAAAERLALEVMTLTDPTGNPLEIFHGPRVDPSRPFHPGRGMHGRFCTGDGGMGHIMLGQRDLDEAYEFYRLLGMRGSIEYRIPMRDGETFDILFMHCNPRDHTFAFAPPGQKKLDHVMLEVDNMDDVFLTYELVQKSEYPVAIGPGKHANDHMFSFYCISPSGFQIEVGWGGRDATHQSEYYTGDTYGHQSVRPEKS